MISYSHAGMSCTATRPLRSVCCGRPMVRRGTDGVVLHEEDREGQRLIAVRWETGDIGNYAPEEIAMEEEGGV